MSRRAIKWIAWSTAVAVIALGAFALTVRHMLHSSLLKDRIVAELSRQLKSDVTLDGLDIRVLPAVRLVGHHLVVKQRQDARARTITVETFTVDPGLRNLLHGRARLVRVVGMQILIPPKKADDAVAPHVAKLAAGPGPRAQTPLPAPPPSSPLGAAPVDESASSGHLDRLVAEQVEIVFLRRLPGEAPRVYEVHDLSIDKLSADGRMPFRVDLTNPKPEGQIRATGVLGPWNGPNPADSPIDGTFNYIDADFDTINGLGGTLSAKGTFQGLLSELYVSGHTDTPDFQLDRGGHPLHLTTTFLARVDGTNGDTYLDSVEGTLARSRISAKGRVVGASTHNGHLIDIVVTVPSGRIEDFLTLVMPAAQPLITGALTMSARLILPPGHTHVIDRLSLDGGFSVRETSFVSPEIQSKVDEFSRRGLGMTEAQQQPGIRADMQGRFRLAAAKMALSAVRFAVPGARVSVDGTYSLNPAELDLEGLLQLQAPVSQAAGGGIKGFLLKAVDPLFKSDNAGTEVPIRITGTQQHPKVGVEFGKLFHRK